MKIETAEQITDSDTAEIARLVAEGYTSVILDRDGQRISWTLDASITSHEQD